MGRWRFPKTLSPRPQLTPSAASRLVLQEGKVMAAAAERLVLGVCAATRKRTPFFRCCTCPTPSPPPFSPPRRRQQSRVYRAWWLQQWQQRLPQQILQVSAPVVIMAPLAPVRVRTMVLTWRRRRVPLTVTRSTSMTWKKVTTKEEGALKISCCWPRRKRRMGRAAIAAVVWSQQPRSRAGMPTRSTLMIFETNRHEEGFGIGEEKGWCYGPC
mmetsp:Transcript_47192/g.93493  ORF Transcript_47192/g.93493 Transcript_47192/m.93493 type:complete len:213 (-) Transcript_47192:73-711(-)